MKTLISLKTYFIIDLFHISNCNIESFGSGYINEFLVSSFSSLSEIVHRVFWLWAKLHCLIKNDKVVQRKCTHFYTIKADFCVADPFETQTMSKVVPLWVEKTWKMCFYPAKSSTYTERTKRWFWFEKPAAEQLTYETDFS